MSLTREVISTPNAPQAVGPYSQAIRLGNMLYTAGQVALDPKTGEIVPGGIEEQTRQVIMNLAAVLEAAGTNFSHVVKTTVFLQDMSDFTRMNAIYSGAFPHEPPARSTVQVAALPKGGRVEIECIALVP